MVVAGVADHTGWAILVSVSLSPENGVPAIVDRRRVELIDPGLPKQPYEHETVGLATAAAEALVQEVRESALHCAERALSQLSAALGATHPLAAIALRTPPLPQLPASVAEVHASPHLTNRADGMLYLEALRAAAQSLGLAVHEFPRGEERPQAAQAAATTTGHVDQYLAGLRAQLGSPWQQDHQTATARAIAALGLGTKLKLPS